MSNVQPSPKRVPRTPAQVLEQQKRDAERSRADAKKAQATAPVATPPTSAQVLARQRQAEPGQQIVPAQTPTTAVTTPGSRTPVETYLDEVAPSSFSGLLVKFNKDGKFVVTSTGDEISESSEFIALCDETMIGWIKFNGEGAPPDRIQGLLYEEFVKPPREHLATRSNTVGNRPER